MTAEMAVTFLVVLMVAIVVLMAGDEIAKRLLR
jgi:hypothetical protein